MDIKCRQIAGNSSLLASLLGLMAALATAVPASGMDSIVIGAPNPGSNYYGLGICCDFRSAAQFTLSTSQFVTTIDVVLYGNSAFNFVLQNSLDTPTTVFAVATLFTTQAGQNTAVISVDSTLPAGTYFLVVRRSAGPPTPTPGWFLSNGAYVSTVGSVANGLWVFVPDGNGGYTWTFVTVGPAPSFAVHALVPDPPPSPIGANGTLVGAPTAAGNYYGMCCGYSLAAQFSLSTSQYISRIDVVLWTNSAFSFSLQSSLISPSTVFSSALLTPPQAGRNTVPISINSILPAGTYYLVGTQTPGSTTPVPGWFASDGSYVTYAGGVANGYWSRLPGGGDNWSFRTSGYAPAFEVHGQCGGNGAATLYSEMTWSDSCPSIGPATQIDAGYVKGQRLQVSWGPSFGTTEVLMADSGESLELWCGTLPGHTTYQYLLFYTPAPSASPHAVGACVWPAGCNSSLFSYSGQVSGSSGTVPACIQSTKWISREVGIRFTQVGPTGCGSAVVFLEVGWTI